jgi:uncharacterized OB-fold protein
VEVRRDVAIVDEESAEIAFQLPPLPFGGPMPVIQPEARPYWEGLKRHQLGILRCQACGHWVHYPLSTCNRCQSFDLKWEAVSGLGTVYTFTVVHREFAPGIMPPFVAALVELNEQVGLRMMTNLVNCKVKDIHIGLPVRVIYHDISEEITLPYWEPADKQTA